MNSSAAMLLRTIAVQTWPALRGEHIREFEKQVDRHQVYNQLVARRLKSCEPVKQTQKKGSLFDLGISGLNNPLLLKLTHCYNCCEFGHMQAVCTKSERPPSGCFKCFETTHLYRVYPARRIWNVSMYAGNSGINGPEDPKEQEINQELMAMKIIIPVPK